MGFIDPIELPVREPRPGFQGRFFHSEHMTFAYYTIAAGSSVHRHHHPNDEVWHVVEGELEVTLGEAVRILHAGPGGRRATERGALGSRGHELPRDRG
jgi:unsaturated pyranuronate lyase